MTADTVRTETLAKPSVEEVNWGVAAHFLGFVGIPVALGFIGPLVVFLVKGEKSAYVRAQAIEAINFNLTALAAIAVSGVLTIVFIGVPMLAAVAVAYIVFTLKAAFTARSGQIYHYPFTYRIAK